MTILPIVLNNHGDRADDCEYARVSVWMGMFERVVLEFAMR